MAFKLLRRREILLPTLWGWLAFAAIAAAVAVVAARGAYGFLATNEPAAAPRFLVVEGWMGDEELAQVKALFASGKYEKIITVGGPLDSRLVPVVGLADFGHWSARMLLNIGIPESRVVPVAVPASAQDRTYLSAVTARDWMQRDYPDAREFDLYSAGVHTRRSRLLYKMAFGPEYRIGAIASRTVDYDPSLWWRSSAGVKTVMSESISYAWTICCFFPPAQGSHEEKWGVKRSP